MATARILAVDDQRYFRELLEEILQAEGYEVRKAQNGAQALQRLDRETFEVIVTDLAMPGLDGLQLIDAIANRGDGPDLIVVSGVVDVKIAVEAMKRGAADYILKPFDRTTLARAVERVLQRRCVHEGNAKLGAENLELKKALRRVESLSLRNGTTEAHTPGFLRELVRREIERCRRHGGSFSILSADFGMSGEPDSSLPPDAPPSGWLRHAVKEVSKSLRATDCVAVDGAGGLAVVLPDADAVGAAILKQRVRSVLASARQRTARRDPERGELAVGAATFPSDGSELGSLQSVLEGRVQEDRESLVGKLNLCDRPFSDSVEALMERALPEPRELPLQSLRFLLDEVGRRPQDRGLLIVAPGPDAYTEIADRIEQLEKAETRTELVLLRDAGTSATGPSGRTLRSDHVREGRCFCVFLGEGPVYASVSGPVSSDGTVPFFHTGERALVELLGLRLRRDLAIPLSAR